MSDYAQRPYEPLGASEEQSVFADNPGPFCPVVLLLDTSGSMGGEPIAQLNRGLRTLSDDLRRDALAAKRVELAIVSFGPVTTDVAFESADRFNPPQLRASGDTPMGRAIETGLDLLDKRRASYRSNGVPYYRPWAFLITDGGPTDSVSEATRRIREQEAAKRLAFFSIGVEGADFQTLRSLSVREPLRLNGLDFTSLFQWLSASLAAVSRSQPGTAVSLPATGWAPV